MAKREKSNPARLASGDAGFGANLQVARKAKELNQEQLAALVGVGKASISQYEKGLTAPSLAVLRSLGEHLGCGVDALLYGQAGASRIHQQPPLPGFSIDERVARLPEAMREHVVKTLVIAERAALATPAKFLKAPTNGNYMEFHQVLHDLAATEVPKGLGKEDEE